MFVRDAWRSLSHTVSSSSTHSAQPVVWQWEHRTGFRDYDNTTIQRIEAAFQRGESHCRLKTGKLGVTPMELFFADMIQYDPITGNTRTVRRLGPNSPWQQLRRRLKGLYIAIETGHPPQMKFLQYCRMKAKNLKNLDGKEHGSGVDLYRQSGCCARIARSAWFSATCMLVVVLNTLWLGIDASLNDKATIWDADAGFLVAEICFSIAFMFELAIRFGAYYRKKDCLRDSWFCYDAFLVLCMLGETWIMLPVWLIQRQTSAGVSRDPGVGEISVLRVMKVVRLTKLGRVARLLRYFPEVMTMLKGLKIALRSVLVTLMLLLVLLYLFGIIFKTTAEGINFAIIFAEPEDGPDLNETLEGNVTNVTTELEVDFDLNEKLNGVVASMWFLVLYGTFLDDVAMAVGALREDSTFLTVLFLVFIFLSSFTLLNLLIGILVDVVMGVSRKEKESVAVSFLKSNLLQILEVHDKDDDRHVRKDEFELLMRNPEVHMTLRNFGVDTEDLISLKDVLFENREALVEAHASELWDTQQPELSKCSSPTPQMQKISFAEFMELVLRLRGGNGASVRDIVDLREYVRRRVNALEVRWPSRSLSEDRSRCQGMDLIMEHFAELQAGVQALRGRLATLEADACRSKP